MELQIIETVISTGKNIIFITLWSGKIAKLRMPTQFNRPWLELKAETCNLLKDWCAENEKGALLFVLCKKSIEV